MSVVGLLAAVIGFAKTFFILEVLVSDVLGYPIFAKWLFGFFVGM
jgi:hypothetical protein